MNWLERYRVTAIALVVAIILIGGAAFLYRQTALPHATEITISAPSTEVRVDVKGAVVNPGVYSLDADDRVADAIEAAGGLAPDADRDAVNLAVTLRDGDRVHIYRIGEMPQRINVNTADIWLLDALPGIGEELAQRIVDYRAENGPFQTIEDLTKVRGIGPAILERVRDKITVR